MGEKKKRSALAYLSFFLFSAPAVWRYGISVIALKGVILCAILVWAGLRDIETHEVPDFISVMILILSFVGFEQSALPSMILGAVSVLIPQLTVCAVGPSRAIGGADIKISAAAAFLLGARRGIAAVLIGLAAGTATAALMRRTGLRERGRPFALVPFLGAGILFSFCAL